MVFSGYIVGYLFLAGVASGAFVVAACSLMWDARRQTDQSELAATTAQYGFYLAPCLAIAAAVLLMVDLGRPERMWEVLVSPTQSVLSMGAWFVLMFVIVSGALVLASICMQQVPRGLQWGCCLLGTVLALGVMSYTGLLLSQSVGVDLWRTPLLVLLFVVSSLSTGVAAVLLTAAVATPATVPIAHSLCRVQTLVGVAEAIVLAAFLLVQQGFSESAAQSVALLTTGSLAPVFWLGVCAFGLALPPIARMFVAGASDVSTTYRSGVVASSVGVLVGGLSLRYCIIAAAVFAALTLGEVL